MLNLIRNAIDAIKTYDAKLDNEYRSQITRELASFMLSDLDLERKALKQIAEVTTDRSQLNENIDRTRSILSLFD